MTDTDTIIGLYPHLRFAKHWDLPPHVEYALGQCEGINEAISDAPILPDFQEKLLLLSLQKGAQATTAIEGNTLSDEEIQKLTPGDSVLATGEYEQREVKNILDTYNGLLERVAKAGDAEIISADLLLRLHRMVGKDLGERFHAVPGQFAQSQRVVAPAYRAPAAHHVPDLVTRLCGWLASEFHYPDQRFSDAVIEAIVAHVYIEWIHPFDDGNGRVGRTMEFYVLLRGGLPAIASHLLANHYNETRAEYYRQLQRAKADNSLTNFIGYAVSGLRDGLKGVLRTVQENAWTQLWRVNVHDAFAKLPRRKGPASSRQRQLALALPLDRSVPTEELPGLSAELTQAYSSVGTRSLLRDVRELETLALITRAPGLVRARRAALEHALPDRRRRSPLS